MSQSSLVPYCPENNVVNVGAEVVLHDEGYPT